MKVFKELEFSDIAKHRDMRCGLGLPNFNKFISKTNSFSHKCKKLGKVFTLEYGKGLKEDDRVNGDYHVMGSNGIVGCHNEYLIEAPAIIVGRKGSAGSVHLTSKKCFPIDTTFYVKMICDDYYLSFLYHYLNFIKLNELSLFKSVPGINRYDIYEAYIPYITKSNQNEIIKEITPYEDKINELKDKLVEPNDIIDKAFSDFFKFDIEFFKTQAIKKYVYVDYTDIFKNSNMRSSVHFNHSKLRITENLFKKNKEWVPIKSKFDLSGGKRIPKGSHFSQSDTGYFYLRPNEINFWGLEKNNIPSISKALYDKLKRYKIKTGEFAISIVGTLGKTYLVNTEDLDINENNLILSENFIKLNVRKNINKQFFYYYFNSIFFKTQIDREYTITSIMKLGIDKWNFLKIPDITPEIQIKIVDEIKKELNKQKDLKKQINIQRAKIDNIIESFFK